MRPPLDWALESKFTKQSVDNLIGCGGSVSISYLRTPSSEGRANLVVFQVSSSLPRTVGAHANLTLAMFLGGRRRRHRRDRKDFTPEEGSCLSGRAYDVKADATGNLEKTYSVGRTSKTLDDDGHPCHARGRKFEPRCSRHTVCDAEKSCWIAPRIVTNRRNSAIFSPNPDQRSRPVRRSQVNLNAFSQHSRNSVRFQRGAGANAMRSQTDQFGETGLTFGEPSEFHVRCFREARSWIASDLPTIHPERHYTS